MKTMELPKYFYFRVKAKNHGTTIEVENASNEDVVEVVRCKDCIYYEELNENEHYCDAIYRGLHGDDEGVDFEPPEDHFCAYGKRREADDH